MVLKNVKKILTLILSILMVVEVMTFKVASIKAEVENEYCLNKDCSLKIKKVGEEDGMPTYETNGKGKIVREKWQAFVFSVSGVKNIEANNITPININVIIKENVQLPDNCNYFFSEFKGYIEIDSSINTSNITSMYAMFYDTAKANPNVIFWDTRSVTSMQYMFAKAKAANPNVDAWGTGNVTNMSYMFYEAKEANPIVTRWDTSNVTNMEYMFADTQNANPILVIGTLVK